MNTAHARKKTLASGSDNCGDKLPTECDDHLLLNRYISEIPAARETRLTRRKAECHVSVSGDQRRTSDTVNSFDRLSTSDYSSSGSSKVSLNRGSRPQNITPLTPLSPASDGSSPKQFSSPEDSEQTHTDVEVQNINGDDVWDSDVDMSEDVEWERDAELHYLQQLQGSTIVKDNILLLIPHRNHLDIPNTSFSISVQPSTILCPRDFILPDTLHYRHLSPVVQVSPCGHHNLFSAPHLAYLFIPLTHTLDQELRDNVVCLFSSSSYQPSWKRLPRDSCKVDTTANFLIVKTCAVGLFTVFYEDRQKVEVVEKRIRRRIGGHLQVESCPELKITFPRGSCPEDINAEVRIFHNAEPWHPDNVETEHKVLACPIIMLGPPGYRFSKDVVIELPVPHYYEVTAQHPSAEFKIYQSHTLHGDPLLWEELDPKRISINKYKNKQVTVSFPVSHFTFFKIVWNTLCRYTYFSNLVAVPMKCVAFMQEVQEDNTFSLEVICYNTDQGRADSIYPHLVGSSQKPKLVKPGNILVKLNSMKFLPNTEAGEEDVLEKLEEGFRGSDFSKQFACVFKEGTKVDKGTFGKVFVSSVNSEKIKMENLFEFNLTKQGVEAEMVLPMESSNDEWSMVAIRELAYNMGLKDDWRRFALSIGVTKVEQDNIQRCGGDPYIEMMKKYQERGGTPEEFVQGLYTLTRTMNVEAACSPGSGSGPGGVAATPPSASSSGVSGSGSQNSQGQEAGAGAGHVNITRRFSLFNLNPWKTHEDSDSGTADHHVLTDGSSPATKGKSGPPGILDLSPTGSRDSRKRSIGTQDKPRSVKRQKVDRSSTLSLSRLGSYSTKNDSYSSSDESGTEENVVKKAKTMSTDRHLRNTYRFEDQDLWKISGEMSSINWRALGRTMGLEESTLLNLEHSFKNHGVRECAYQMMLEWKEKKPKTCTFGSLYSALTTEKMNGIAKKLVKLLEEGNFKK